MITLYELKSNSSCRCFIRTPFYIKNAFLLAILTFMMSIIYVLYFRRDGGNFSQIPRILKGLNSNTFNYLETHSETLRLTKLLNNYQAQISTNQFIDDCVRVSKPCKFEGMAKTWPGFTKLQYNEEKGGYDYLKNKLGDMQVDVYLDLEADSYSSASISSSESFKQSSKTKMKYSDFLKKMDGDQVTVAMRENHDNVMKSLIKEIALPNFYEDISDIQSLELIQGKIVVNSAHYEKQEQFLCAIDGIIQLKMIPHIYKQEVYAGKDKLIVDPDAAAVSKEKEPAKIHLDPNQSPIDFFSPDIENYPNFEEIERKYTVLLHEGDCVFIPAYYFYQYVGKADVEGSLLSVALKYNGNSQLLHGFFEAIERNILL
eukprot:403360825